MEHDNAKQALARIREVTENFTLPADASATLAGLYAALQQLERDLLTHIREEDDILFPRTVALEDELFKS
jgi:regulator of cell morphogenesis and NO signaling